MWGKLIRLYLLHQVRVDNQVRNSEEPCTFPHGFFQNSPPSPSLKAASSNNLGGSADGIPTDSQKDLPSNSSHNKKEPQENDPIDPSSPKDSSSPSSTEKVQKPVTPLPSFPHRLKKKDQASVDKIRETFSQVKISIPLLDAIQMPPYARFLKDLCTTKRATSVPKKSFFAASASSIIFYQIPMKYKDPRCPTNSIVTGD